MQLTSSPPPPSSAIPPPASRGGDHTQVRRRRFAYVYLQSEMREEQTPTCSGHLYSENETSISLLLWVRDTDGFREVEGERGGTWRDDGIQDADWRRGGGG
ncbi:hypothetical protein FQA47_016094 [Oryzias melastigma]|uniref:Uncharacterized protein n=1 Tax=Oryzias melastigma TaxID=30732 RepID=A0A834FN24_ORYME|nr:hypothetical protein FQA47_016094 [Oryzias melastigma]